MSLRISFICLMVLSCVLVAAADDDPQGKTDGGDVRIENEVVVTATRNEAEVKTVGSAVTVITREDIRKHHYLTVADALEDVPGIQVLTTGAFGAVATVSIRGAQSEQTLVLVDGVELNDPMGTARGFDFSSLVLNNVERIEIVRGPQSTLYGSDAIGGIVNIITRSGEGRPVISATVEGGKYRTARVQAGVNGSTGRLRYSLSAARVSSRGFSAAAERFGNTEPDAWRNATLNGKLDFTLTDSLDGSVFLHYTDAWNDLDNWGGAFGDDPNYRGRVRQAAGKGELNYRHPSGLWQQKLQFSFSRTGRKYVNGADDAHPGESSTGDYTGELGKLGWEHIFFPVAGHTLTAGYEYQREQGDSLYHSESPWGPYDSVFPQQHADTHSVYFQDQMDVGGRFFLTSGVRYDHLQRFGGNVSVRAAPVLLLEGSDTRLHMSAGTGFKAPSLYQLYAPPSAYGPVGNLDLSPEKSWSVDGGFDQYFCGRRVWMDLTGFYNRFRDLIVFIDGYENQNRAETYGLETQLRWSPVEWLRASGAYTLTRSRDLDTGDELLRRARHVVSGTVEFRPASRWNLIGQWIYKGARWDMDYSGYPSRRVRLGDYLVVNAIVNVHVTDGVELFGKCYNMLNRDIEELYGFQSTGFALYGGIRFQVR